MSGNLSPDLGYETMNARAKRKEKIIQEILREFPNACVECMREAMVGECC